MRRWLLVTAALALVSCGGMPDDPDGGGRRDRRLDMAAQPDRPDPPDGGVDMASDVPTDTPQDMPPMPTACTPLESPTGDLLPRPPLDRLPCELMPPSLL